MKILLWISLVIYLLVAALIGLVLFFADSTSSQMIGFIIYFIVAGGLVGLFIPSRWQVASFIALAPLAVLFMSLSGAIQYAEQGTMTKTIVIALLSAALTMISSYVTAELRFKKKS